MQADGLTPAASGTDARHESGIRIRTPPPANPHQYRPRAFATAATPPPTRSDVKEQAHPQGQAQPAPTATRMVNVRLLPAGRQAPPHADLTPGGTIPPMPPGPLPTRVMPPHLGVHPAHDLPPQPKTTSVRFDTRDRGDTKLRRSGPARTGFRGLAGACPGGPGPTQLKHIGCRIDRYAPATRGMRVGSRCISACMKAW